MCSMSANETNTYNSMKWVPGMQFTRENRVFRCGWLRWREWDCVGALLGCSAADRVAATQAHASQAVSASGLCNQKFCPPSRGDTRLQIQRAPRSAATWVDVIVYSTIYSGADQNKTGVECRQTLGPLRSINPNMINHFIKQSPLLFSKSYTGTCCLYMNLFIKGVQRTVK